MKNSTWRIGAVPLGLFYVAFFLLPQLSFLAISLFKSTGPGQMDQTITGANYVAIAGDDFFYRAMVNTLELSAATASISLLIGFPIAYAIAQKPRIGKYLFILVVATMFSSAVALALGWQSLLADDGGVNGMLKALGIIRAPLPLSANFTAVLIGTVHGSIPVMVLGLVPACEALPALQLEAALGLGASQWMTFWNVILPQTFRGALSMALIVFAITTSAFTTPALLGGGQVALLSLSIREQLLTIFDYPKAATLAAVLIGITLLVIALTRGVLRQRGSVGLGGGR